MRTKRIMAALAAVLSLVTGLLAGCGQEKAVQGTPEATAVKPAPGKRTPPASDAAVLAARFEHASRDWGVDPAAALAAQPGSDTQDALASLRAPARLDRTALDAVSTVKAGPADGPDAPGPLCDGTKGVSCQIWPTQLAYWRQQHWLMGARLDGEPTITPLTGGRVKVSGKVRAVLWSDVDDRWTVELDGTDGSHWWGFSPVAGDMPYTDILTVSGSKVTARQYVTATGWMGDPFLRAWGNLDPADDNGMWENRVQPSIPLRGAKPQLGLQHDPAAHILRNAATFEGWPDSIMAKAPAGNPGID